MISCPQLSDALNSAFSHKYHSLAQYMLDAQPFVPAGMEGALAVVREIAAEDKRFADRLAEVIESLEGVPQLATFNPGVANLNYLALNYLAKVLLGELCAELTEYEGAVGLTEESASARAVLTALAEATRTQIERLRAVCPAA